MSQAGGGRRWPTGLLAAALAAGALVGGVVGGLVGARYGEDDDGAGTAGSRSPNQPAAASNVTVQHTDAVVRAAARASASVVRIESTRRVQGGIEQDVGSGIVVDDQGHIVTNAHVVLGTESLKIILPDGSTRPAILVGHDSPFTDVAVLQVGPGSLTPIEVGRSSAVALGETVIAIGNPLTESGGAGSVTVGVVSGLGRSRTFDGVVQPDLIQTDAALNGGNSGGALVNLQGQFIGMPTAILRQSRNGQVIEGIGFALPSDRLLMIANRMIAVGGSYPRPTLGIDHADLSAEVAARLRLGVEAGALVSEVTPNGPAAAAGIVRGDVITKLGDVDVNRSTPFLNALAKYEPGQAVQVVLNRNGRIIETEVRLGTRS